MARGSESRREGGPHGEQGLVGRSQILESLVNHVKNVFNQSRLEEKSTDLEQMLRDIGNGCGERSGGSASARDGGAGTS